MSDWHKALMRTRCPQCGTQFRVTSEQLRRKFGKVRCGECQIVFNAFDHWIGDAGHLQPPPREVRETELLPSAPLPVVEELSVEAISWAQKGETSPTPPANSMAQESCDDNRESGKRSAADNFESLQEAGHGLSVDSPEIAKESIIPDVHPEASLTSSEEMADVIPATALHQTVPIMGGSEITQETTEETTLAAKAAGLVAARELSETAAYDRWAEGTLANGGDGAFFEDTRHRVAWPFTLVSLLLLLTLTGQVLHHFRTDLVLRMPALDSWYRAVGISVPLSRDPSLVSIETSDLQADSAKGSFVLLATLKNSAAHEQDWPALELTLTDINDAVVARRIFQASEYRPATKVSKGFPANGEISVRLGLEAREIDASGYRLYIFYP